jgi:hypothetical protein
MAGCDVDLTAAPFGVHAGDPLAGPANTAAINAAITAFTGKRARLVLPAGDVYVVGGSRHVLDASSSKDPAMVVRGTGSWSMGPLESNWPTSVSKMGKVAKPDPGDQNHLISLLSLSGPTRDIGPSSVLRAGPRGWTSHPRWPRAGDQRSIHRLRDADVWNWSRVSIRRSHPARLESDRAQQLLHRRGEQQPHRHGAERQKPIANGSSQHSRRLHRSIVGPVRRGGRGHWDFTRSASAAHTRVRRDDHRRTHPGHLHRQPVRQERHDHRCLGQQVTGIRGASSEQRPA